MFQTWPPARTRMFAWPPTQSIILLIRRINAVGLGHVSKYIFKASVQEVNGGGQFHIDNALPPVTASQPS